jgi:hypothetical protein
MSIISFHAAILRDVCRAPAGLCRSGVARISGKGHVRISGTRKQLVELLADPTDRGVAAVERRAPGFQQ